MGGYNNRSLYRDIVGSADLVHFNVRIKETDMMILADEDLSDAAGNSVLKHRLLLENYIRRNPDFLTSLVPLETGDGVPFIVSLMASAAWKADVGPMAAVAGAMAECVGDEMRKLSRTVIIENGGDIYLSSPDERVVGMYAGTGPGEFDFGLKIDSSKQPVGVCTSSGRIGHSYSAGISRAATVVASSAALADAAATALGNNLKQAGDIRAALEKMAGINGVSGAVAVLDEKMGLWGKINLVQLPKGRIRR